MHRPQRPTILETIMNCQLSLWTKEAAICYMTWVLSTLLTCVGNVLFSGRMNIIKYSSKLFEIMSHDLKCIE
jgi:hypothetical protein